ncbi:hypothetical protein SAY87_029369 [Trapa incisa]|uniref:Helicase ATP-binding domain-containing protein n=1 Tax=Trapa incisa TaxID=236973 RepID=A0AAN7KEE1_9MYRT|nr:hypothetical protein SAY87_029369 [Trapa incisa]
MKSPGHFALKFAPQVSSSTAEPKDLHSQPNHATKSAVHIENKPSVLKQPSNRSIYKPSASETLYRYTDIKNGAQEPNQPSEDWFQVISKENSSEIKIKTKKVTHSDKGPYPVAWSVSLPFTEKPHFNSLVTGPCTDGNARRHFGGLKGSLSGFVPCAIATPNSVLSQEAFRNLGRGFSEDNDGEGVSEDELAVSMLGLPQRLVETLEKRGITHLFPIQVLLLSPFPVFCELAQELFAYLLSGHNCSCQNLYREPLAFEIPIIKSLTEDEDDPQKIIRRGRQARVLVLTPTRELAKQVEKEIKESAPYLNTVCVYGGVSYITQQNALSGGVDVVVGTPGRIIDMLNGGSLKLGEVEYLVLDEADQMLVVGFEEDVEVILEKLCWPFKMMDPRVISMADFLAEIVVVTKEAALGIEEDPDHQGVGAVVGILMMIMLRTIFHLGVVDKVEELRIVGPVFQETIVITGLLGVEDHQAGRPRLRIGGKERYPRQAGMSKSSRDNFLRSTDAIMLLAFDSPKLT